MAKVTVVVQTVLSTWTELPDDRLESVRSLDNDFVPLPGINKVQVDYRLAAVHDYGGRTGIYRLLRQLERFGVRGCLGVSGLAWDRYQLARDALVAAGQEPVAHGLAQDLPHRLLTPELRAEDVRRSCASYVAMGAGQPRGWLSPGLDPLLPGALEMLVAQGIEWVWLPDTVGPVQRVHVGDGSIVVIPMGRRTESVDSVRIMHGVDPRMQLERFVGHLEAAREADGLTVVPVVMRADLHTPNMARCFELMLEHACGSPDVVVTSPSRLIAEHLGAADVAALASV